METLYVELAANVGTFVRNLGRAASTVSSVEDATLRLQAAQARQLQAQERLAAVTRSASRTAGQLAAAEAELASATRGVERAQEQASEATREQARTQSRAAKAFDATKAAAVAGGAAIGAALVAATRSAMEFDTAMRNVQSIGKQSEGALRSLGDEVVQLSTQLPQSAATLAEGLYDVASSGFQGEEGMKVLRAAAVAASAGMSDTATAAQAITAALNAYGRGAEDAADVSDTLFSTVNLGVTTFETLANNVGDYLGAANALGVSFAETGSAIATLTLTGTAAGEAGTILGSVLNGLIKPSEGMAGALRDAGYASGTAAIEALGLRGAMELVREASGGTAEGMSELFGDTTAVRGALGLATSEGAKYAEVAAKMEDPSARAGAAQGALAEQSKAASYQMQLLSNQMEAAQLAVGRFALPILVDGLERVQAAGAAAGPVLMSIAERLGPVWEDLVTIVGNVGDVVGDLAVLAAPVAAALAQIAGGAVLGAFTALLAVLEPLSGFLADNELAATALGIAFGVRAAGGVAALTNALRLGLMTALVNARVGVALLGDGLTGLRSRMTLAAAASGALAAGFTIGLAALAVGFSRANQQVDTLRSALNSFGNANGLAAQVTAANEASTAAEAYSQRLAELEERSTGEKLKLTSLLDNIEYFRLSTGEGRAYAEQAVRNKEETERFQTALISIAESGFRPGTTAANTLHNELINGGPAWESLSEKATAAGIKVGDSAELMAEKLAAYDAANTGAQAATSQTAGALAGLQAGAEKTEDALDRLKRGLDALLGVPLNAAEAAIAYEAALDDLAETLVKTDEKGKRLGVSLDRNTERGREVESAFIAVVRASTAKVEADAAAGVSADKLSGQIKSTRDALIRQGTQMGLTKEQMDTLLTSYGLAPDRVATLVEATGTGAAKENVEGVKTAVDGLEDKNVTVGVTYTGGDWKADPGKYSGTKWANGGIAEAYANGGMREHHVAQIARPGAMRLWAEPETGGEAYIPLAASKRSRSLSILSEVADRFGLQLLPNALGSVYQRVMADAQRLITGRAPDPKDGTGPISGDLVTIGRMLQQRGFRVSEHPAFGGVRGRHSETSKHYAGRAIDVNYGPGGQSAEETRAINALLAGPLAGTRFAERLWQVKGHFDHLHLAMADGGVLGGLPAPIAGEAPMAGRAGRPLTPQEVERLKERGGLMGMASGGLLRFARGGTTGKPKAAKAAPKPKLGPKNTVRIQSSPIVVPKSPLRPGETLAGAAGRGDSVQAIEALIAAYERYAAAADKARERAALVGDVRQAQREYDTARGIEARTEALTKLKDATGQLSEFDREYRAEQQRTRAQSALERKRLQKEAADARAEAARSAEDNKFAVGDQTAQQRIAVLDKRLKAERKYTDAWTALYQERARLLEDEAEKEKAAADAIAAAARSVEDNRFAVGDQSAAERIAVLDQRLAAETRYSDAWTALYRERQSIIESVAAAEKAAAQEALDALEEVSDAAERAADDAARVAGQAQQAADEALADLNRMIDQYESVKARQVEVQQRYDAKVETLRGRELALQRDFARDSGALAEQLADAQQAAAQQAAEREAQAQAQYAQQVEQALRTRRSQLQQWAQLDQRAVPAWGNTLEQLLRNAQDQAGQFAEWAQELQAARARGLSEAAIQSLGLDEGPEALGQLRQFRKATDREIGAFNDAVAARAEAAGAQTEREQAALLGKLGDDIKAANAQLNAALLTSQQQHATALLTAERTYAASLTALQERFREGQAQLAAELEQAEAELVEAQEELAAELAAIGQEQGRGWAAAIAAGIESQLPGILAAVAKVKAALQELAEAKAAEKKAQADLAAAKAATAAAEASKAGSGVNNNPVGGQEVAESAWREHGRPGDTVSNANGDQVGVIGADGQLVRTATYDVGGWLQPGYTLAYNGTGKPERVMTAAQAAAPQQAGPTNVGVRVFIGDRELTDIVDVRIDSTLGQRASTATIAGRR